MRTNKQTIRLCWVIAIALVGLSAFTANTATGTVIVPLTFDANYEYSGASAPAGTAPWLRAQFDDGGSSGSVTLTLTAINLTGDESVKDWLFNVNPAMNLTFSAPTKVSGKFDLSAFSISQSTDGCPGDGGGYYDLDIGFPDTDGPNTRFTNGDSVSFTITGPSLTANSFNCLSYPHGGNGVYTMAAHVQNTPAKLMPDGSTSTSGWVAPVPEPSTLILLGIASLGVLASIWRKRSVG
jgi:hypothetical protein